MRISKIKLAGFKSFVDPTVLLLSGNLTGIVGPNGCGKSNIIDALLWVMGESSAKHLRGDSMADVIFNGSSSRKPVGQAVVEIVFDNKDQSLGGQYASYGEIAIKRQVSRDGASVYYLNGARCRRRDITDLFLGKGIGSRSYSVIEQGMISRVIEAKPEELRLFLEEAAGISKYKERRQETENRLRHTKDNLNRLNDLRNELHERLAHLNQQAQAAERYQRLKESQRRTQAELLGLNWRTLQNEFEARDHNIQQRETALEGVLAHLREIELSIEKTRDAQSEATEWFNQVQAKYYTLGAEVSRLEQDIQHVKERRATLERDLRQASREHTEVEGHITQNECALAELKTAIENATPAHEQLMAGEQEAYDRLVKSEQALQVWQAEWDRFNQQTSEVFREEKGETTRIAHLESNLVDLRKRLEALRRENEGLAPEGLENAIQDLNRQIGEAEIAFQQIQSLRAGMQDQLEKVREQIDSLSPTIDQDRHAQQVTSGRLASLQALQQSAQASDHASVREWLEKQGLAGAPCLSQEITVQAGWETAAETVLDSFLHALHVPCLEGVAQDLSSLQQGSLAFFDSHWAEGEPSQPQSRVGFARLDEKITSPWPVDGLLNGVYSVETLAEALHLRPQLQPHESVVTQDGSWLGPHWLWVKRDQDQKAGILKREREIKGLENDHQKLQARIAEDTDHLGKARRELKHLERDRDEIETKLMAAQGSLGALRSELAAKETELGQLRSRKDRVETDIQDLDNQEFRDAAELESIRIRLESIQREVSSVEERRSEQLQERDALGGSLQSAREEWRQTKDRRHELALRLESMRTQCASLQQALNRSKALADQIAARASELSLTLSRLEDPRERMKTELERALEERLAVEEQLRSARAQSQALDSQLREQDQARANCERQLQSMRGELEQARLDGQAILIHLENIEGQLKSLGYPRQALMDELPPDAEKDTWEKRLETVERKVQRLGPINLAAIDEFAQLSERKDYLDRQHDDLAQALETLENAIRKIDRETQSRFKETFDKVNASLQTLFPILFGGGHAHLELTSEDLLETGVHVIAHPPGKRNSTIHLLSGGEKALTALALVFSIYELNPAPFCLLDEVDAPLDDANVVRLCDMLKGRSERVQFLFVTHNKTTMEIAENLIGVTTQEAGVSRLVAVDIDKAMAMVATG